MTFYSDMAALADELLTEFGQLITFNRSAPGTYDPTTGTIPSPVVASGTGYGALFDYGGQNFYHGETQYVSTLIEKGDRQLYVSPDVTLALQIGDTATINGEDWSIVSIKPLEPAGIVVLYECQVRR